MRSLALLERFYGSHGLPVPRVETLCATDLPQPYRRLLVHSQDMTSTLETFHGHPMAIEVLGRKTASQTYFREVLLVPVEGLASPPASNGNGGHAIPARLGRPVEYGVNTKGTKETKADLPARLGRPVEYGVIRIELAALREDARQAVLDAQRPLGNILQTHEIPYLSWPQGFFRVGSDRHLGHVLQLERPTTLYGRRNLLLDGSRRLIAEVMEILAPAPDREHEAQPSNPD